MPTCELTQPQLAGNHTEAGENLPASKTAVEFEQAGSQVCDFVLSADAMLHAFSTLIKSRIETALRVVSPDLKPAQALMLYRMPAHGEISVGMLRNIGAHTGTNASYQVKKLAGMGYISYNKSLTDQRSVDIGLTEKGQNVQKAISRCIANFEAGLTEDMLQRIGQSSRTISGVTSVIQAKTFHA